MKNLTLTFAGGDELAFPQVDDAVAQEALVALTSQLPALSIQKDENTAVHINMRQVVSLTVEAAEEPSEPDKAPAEPEPEPTEPEPEEGKPAPEVAELQAQVAQLSRKVAEDDSELAAARQKLETLGAEQEKMHGRLQKLEGGQPKDEPAPPSDPPPADPPPAGQGAAADNRTVAELKAALDAKGVTYPSDARKAELLELAKANGV